MWFLTESEQARLENAITAVFAAPFIDDIEDFVWEAVFGYVKQIPIRDPLIEIRSKRLFDVVDSQRRIGWSAKALQHTLRRGVEFELVIQRADIFKKSDLLGFPERLSLQSDPNILGYALLQHWHQKVIADAQEQQVDDKRICVLLKSPNRTNFAYYEDQLVQALPDDLIWRWTDASKTGLQGFYRVDGFCKFRWYPNQKQLFERFKLPDQTPIFNLDIQRLLLSDVINLLRAALDRL